MKAKFKLHKVSVSKVWSLKSWLKEFNDAGGFSTIHDIILECKIKYSTLYNNNTGSQYYNSSMTLSGGSFANSNYNSFTLNANNSNYNLSTYNNNEFKDKDTQLIKEIRYECIRTLKSFVNTTVCFSKCIQTLILS